MTNNRIIKLLLALLLSTCAASVQAKIYVIAMDGINWDLINPLLKQGKLPNFEKLISQSATGTMHTKSKSLISPATYTSIFTGKTVPKHGILGYWDDNGTKPYTSADRKAAAIWDIATLNHSSSAVVGVLATWPTEPIAGAMVSERYVDISDAEREKTFYPPSLKLEVQPGYYHHEIRWFYKSLKRFSAYQRDTTAKSKTKSFMSPIVIENYLFNNVLIPAFATDESLTRIFEQLEREGSYDFNIIFLPAIDWACNYFWLYQTQKGHVFQPVIENYTIYYDELLGRLLKTAKDDDYIFVLSDHKFTTLKTTEKYPLRTTLHIPYGLFIAKGPGIDRNAKNVTPSELDITPTLLYIKDWPVAADMDGKVIREIFTEDSLKNHPVKTVTTYGVRPAQKLEFKEINSERLRVLKEQGY